ncbi:response regulator [Auraticoccus sp. F435]|uniref:Response regulator n=1 Tax=Auraticoccus cholistanensis TaxID=2656650 RepID=A0A6A9UUP9_9ACTN|nr:FAD-dependent oxidoreductase [Auraticoccus cholistanensis]MVA75465.1 response regulator [Auraticoccus cholistanensis]
MTKPTILTVDDDPGVLASISRDLRSRYGRDYRIVQATSGAKALDVLAEHALRARPVALIATDQRMPGMSGVQMLSQARQHVTDAKFLLLTAYADTDAAIQAINDVGLDYYLLKPWDPPAERLYPVVDDLLGDWRQEHPPDAGELRVVGHRWSERSHEVKTFLTRNHVPYQWLQIDRDDEARRLVELAQAGPDDLPLVLVPEGEPLRAPSNLELAGALGLRTRAEQPLYDLCIVGGGPAGLAAAVYAASEGLRTVVVEREAPGGQAGQSASIENYLGFPKGLSGADLAHRAVTQAARFGAEMLLARDVVALETRGPVRAVRFSDSGELEARAVLVASGVSYRRLEGPGLAELAGRGVYYGSSASEASQCQGDEVYVVGGANSAGQAALNFARYAKRVVMVVRGKQLEDTMSLYLVAQIRAKDNIEVRLQSSVVAARGDGHLAAITLCEQGSPPHEVPATWLFVYIGASPRTDWLGSGVVRDPRGFVLTGQDVQSAPTPSPWPLARAPFALETSVPGVFAAGDVRLDSMKRVASAVGEGAMAVYLVHRYLATT